MDRLYNDLRILVKNAYHYINTNMNDIIAYIREYNKVDIYYLGLDVVNGQITGYLDTVTEMCYTYDIFNTHELEMIEEIENRKINDNELKDLILDATKKKIADNMMSLRDKEIKIYKGDIIVKKGEIIDSDAFLKLEKLNLVRNGDKFKKAVGLITTFSLLLILIYFLLKKNVRKVVESNAFYPTLLTIIVVNIFYVLFSNNQFLIYLLPFAMLPIISTIIGNKTYAIIMTFSNLQSG